jgi:DNA-binding XRE family transcriptional regulator
MHASEGGFVGRNSGNGAGLEYGEMGDRLREARVSRGLSLRGLAERVGVSPSLISQVETGRAKPSVSTLYALGPSSGSRSTSSSIGREASHACGRTRSRRGVERLHDAAGPFSGRPIRSDPARVGRHLGAADDGVDAATSTSCT